MDIHDLRHETAPDFEPVDLPPTDDFRCVTTAREDPLLPYDHCVNHVDTEELLLSAISQDYLRATSAPLSSLDPESMTPDMDMKLNQAKDTSYPFTSALVHMTSLVNRLDGDRCLAYQEIQQSDPTWHTDVRAHIDGGSMVTTTHDSNLVWYQQPVSRPPTLRVADKRPHYPTHRGYLCIQASTGPTLVPTYLTPTLPATILSPDATCRSFDCIGYTAISNCDGHNCSVTMRHCKRRTGDLHIPAVLRRGMLYTRPLIAPTEEQRTGRRPSASLPSCMDTSKKVNQTTTDCQCCPDTVSTESPTDTVNDKSSSEPITDIKCDEPSSTPLYCAACTEEPELPEVSDIHSLSRDQLKLLWHLRLGHLNAGRISTLHKCLRGFPKLPDCNELEKCPICTENKLHRSSRNPSNSTRTATIPFQGLSVDFGFVVQKSSTDSDRVRRLQGHNGETCYCVITDHATGMTFGECFVSKAPPIEYFNAWLAKYNPSADVKDKYVRFDPGGDLGKCHEVLDLFEKAHYDIQLTAPGHSHQNGPVERPHRTIGDAMRTMLRGADLPAKFWPYAFHHYLRIYNSVPHGDSDKSPIEKRTGVKPTLSYLRTFGCRVVALPARERRPSKLDNDPCRGVFLGFSRTGKNAIYYDTDTNKVKTTADIAYNEAEVGFDRLSPHATALHGVGVIPSATDKPVKIDNECWLDVQDAPWSELHKVSITLGDLDSPHPIYCEVLQCGRLRRPFLNDIHRGFRGMTKTASRKKFLKSYVVAINDDPVFTVEALMEKVAFFQNYDEPPETVVLTLAPERQEPVFVGSRPSHLRISEIIADYPDAILHQLQTDCMTPEEKQLKRLTRRTLKALPNWKVWDDAYNAQLDDHAKAGVFGKPVRRQDLPAKQQQQICRFQWTSVV